MASGWSSIVASGRSSIVASDCGSNMASGRKLAESSDHDSGAKFSPSSDKGAARFRGKAGSPLTKADQEGQIVAEAPIGRDQETGQSSLAARQVGKTWQETDFFGGDRRTNCAGNAGNAEEERRENEKEILKSL